MGSLYDIGNMRYKHFTFYSRGSANEYTPLGPDYVSDPTKTPEENAILASAHPAEYKKLIESLKDFLDNVWPLDAVFGHNAEDDTAFVTYIKQGSDGVVAIENIYTFRRSTAKDALGTARAIWTLTLNPTKTLRPTDLINQAIQEGNE